MSDLRNRFERLRALWIPAVLDEVDAVILAGSAEHSLLRRMLRYQMQTGGKRLRAILPLLIADALGSDPARLVPFGAACEILHNASTVHDDVQDGDVVRRGSATVWKKFGLAQAVNLGDALIAFAILLMQRIDAPAHLKEKATSRMLHEMLRVIEGQVEDLELRNRPHVSLSEYLRMVEQKTSRLFALPLSGSALLCGAGEELEAALVDSACHIGMLFQIHDDILDVYGDKGRGEMGNDIREGKRSFLVVHCLENASSGEAERLLTILDKPRAATSENDISECRALFDRTESFAAAMDHLGYHHRAALSIPGLAGYPALREVLDEACSMFLSPAYDLQFRAARIAISA